MANITPAQTVAKYANEMVAEKQAEIDRLRAEVALLRQDLAVCREELSDTGAMAEAIPNHQLDNPRWPDPTPEMLASPEFEAIWQCIKRWDVNVPSAYVGYCGANGNHVRAILDALTNRQTPQTP